MKVKNVNKASLKIKYYAFQYNNSVEDFNEIEKFKDEIDQSYSSIVKPIPIGRGGGAYELVVDFFVNLTAEDYLKGIGSYLGTKLIDRIIDPIFDSYVLNPLKEAYKKLKSENPFLECYSITIELLDTKIFLYSISPDSIINNKNEILLSLDKHFNNLIIKEEFPSEIHIPVYQEQLDDKHIYRPPFGIQETTETENNNIFFKLWGLKYQYSYSSIVYDVVNSQILYDSIFMTEDELNYFKNNK